MPTDKPTIVKSNASTKNLAPLYGGLGGGLMILYFFLINALGLQQFEAVRFGCHAFTVLAVVLAIRAFKARNSSPAPYLPGLGLGFLVGLLGSVLFAGFVFVYAHIINAGYLDELRSQTYFNTSVNSYMLFATFVVLGIVIGSLTGYILMMGEDTGPEDKFDTMMRDS